jgi:hypothetical protein
MFYSVEAFVLALAGIGMGGLLLLRAKTQRTSLAKLAILASSTGLCMCSRYLFLELGLSSEVIVIGAALIMVALGIEGLKQRTSAL